MNKLIGFAYICGFFDGEGNIQKVRQEKIVPMVTISQSEGQHEVLFVMQQFLNKHKISCQLYRSERPQEGHRPIWNLKITNRKSVIRFLRAMRPYAFVKLEQLERALRYLRVITWNHSLVDQERCEHARQAYHAGYSFRDAAKQTGIDSRTLRIYMGSLGETGRSKAASWHQTQLRHKRDAGMYCGL